MVDGLEQVEKGNAVLGVLLEVLVDHVERALEHVLKNYGHLIGHHRLSVYESAKGVGRCQAPRIT